MQLHFLTLANTFSFQFCSFQSKAAQQHPGAHRGVSVPLPLLIFIQNQCKIKAREMMAEINYHNKDRLFRFIFGNPENKDWTPSLICAIQNMTKRRQ